jgi:hypothetical protein
MTAPDLNLPAVCLSCGSPTGTCHGAEGEPGWVADFLVYLGLAKGRAEAAVSGQGDGLATGGRIILLIPICMQCALRVGVRTALCLPEFDTPTTRQPAGDRS